jgi:predicted nucleic-acid-binding protein
MNGVDTNVLLRLLLRDDEDQARRADAFVERSCSAESPCLINRIVLVEVVWVLQSGYGYHRNDVATIIENILRTDALAVEGAPEAWAALADYREQAADFADCLIGKSNRGQGCEATATFDKAATLLAEFELI